MIKKNFSIGFLLVLLFSSFSCSEKGRTVFFKPLSTDSCLYAQNLIIERHKDFNYVRIKNSWDTSKFLNSYILVEKNKELPSKLPEGVIIRTPIDSIGVFTSVHIAILEELDVVDRVIGVCESEYVNSDYIQSGISSGRIKDLGSSFAPNVETILDIGTQVLISSPFENHSYGATEKTDIPIIEGADYLEPHPLGRVEWLRFYGMLTGKEKMADSIFRAVVGEYNYLKTLTDSVEYRPTLLTESIYGSSWLIPQADSYMVRMYKDAGAKYIFDDLPGTGSSPFPFEAVLDKGMNADFWLLKYYSTYDYSYSDFKDIYEHYSLFSAFQNKKIYGCNTYQSTYYEDIAIHPERILKSLINIFHPGLTQDSTMVWEALK